MINSSTIATVFALFGILLGLVFPGYVLYLVTLGRKWGLSWKFLAGALKTVAVVVLIIFFLLGVIGFAAEYLAIPENHEPTDLALGFGFFGGALVGLVTLIYGIARGRRSKAA